MHSGGIVNVDSPVERASSPPLTSIEPDPRVSSSLSCTFRCVLTDLELEGGVISVEASSSVLRPEYKSGELQNDSYFVNVGEIRGVSGVSLSSTGPGVEGCSAMSIPPNPSAIGSFSSR